jgi:RNA 3'-terminal phosphate cyclase
VITCTAEFAGGARLGGDALGGAGRSAERVGREAGERLSREIQDGAVVDAHAADQLIVWLGISGGALRTSEISGHVDASIWIARSFVGDAFEVEGKVIRCSRPWVPGTMG